MSSLVIVAASLLPLLLVYVVFRRPGTIQKIQGPSSPSWIFGNTLQLLLSAQYGEHEFAWQKLYGAVYRLKNCFGVRSVELLRSCLIPPQQDRLMVSDPAALHYIVNSSHFKIAPALENQMYLLYGRKSLVLVPAEEHKSLRAALNVGFTAAAVRSYQSIFEKAASRLTEELNNSSSATIDICPLLSFATLSTIGEAVLGQSPEDLGEELIQNNLEIVKLAATQSRLQILADAVASHLPVWLFRAAARLPTSTLEIIRTAKRLAEELGNRIVEEKRAAARDGLDTDGDLFGVLCTTKNGLAGDVIAAQTALMLIAGQETTATTLVLGLRELARLPAFQVELRSEITANAGNIAYDSMPLLNAFIKESLRMFPIFPIDDRIAREDTVIPLSEKIRLSTGEDVSEIFIQKGQMVSIAIASFQRLESRWGKDAHEFNPNRWLQGSAYSGGEALGPYANLLSFLGGPHNCLGISEMQIFICELARRFSFALPEDDAVHICLVNSLMPVMSNGQKVFISGADSFGPASGDFTSFQGKHTVRKTVIDYAVCSRELFAKSKSFNVQDQVQGYDHAALTLNIELDVGDPNRVLVHPRKKRKVELALTDVTPPLKVTVHGVCLNAGKITASSGAAAYWGPNARTNVSARTWGSQTSPRADLLSVLIALNVAPLFKSLEISSRSEYAIRSITYCAAGNDACGWKCANGDILKLILVLVKCRTAPIHFCHIQRDQLEVAKNGHLTQATTMAREACDLPRAHGPIALSPLVPLNPESGALDVQKVTADIPNNMREADDLTPKPVRPAFPAPHRGRNKSTAMSDKNRKRVMEAPNRAAFWKEVKRLANPKPAPFSVTADELKTVFEKRLNPQELLPPQFDAAQHVINKILVTLLPEKTEDHTPEGFSVANGQKRILAVSRTTSASTYR
ncbi:cytochrome P450 [Mycena metata]|uniref:Cytochrome P450 n=1 Tax=Mycena metata TaxID=1033252 RepID=A0AAD7JK40_9AGAR|nr:cytochrome P450 [Mycena metata]